MIITALTPLENVSIKRIEMERADIESLEMKYGLYSFYIDIGTNIVYGIDDEKKIKRIGKLIVLENGKLKIEE
ncbi:MAG: hypothetical protein KAI71_06680 [Candidatus Pacebacteria bacterium]|nr:hypothetical protein [Candidatus Paceibacterota bacterium]